MKCYSIQLFLLYSFQSYYFSTSEAYDDNRDPMNGISDFNVVSLSIMNAH